MKKFFYTLGLVCVLSLVCGACGKKSESAGTEQEASGPDAQLKQLEEVVVKLETAQKNGTLTVAEFEKVAEDITPVGQALTKLYDEDKLTDEQKKKFEDLQERANAIGEAVYSSSSSNYSSNYSSSYSSDYEDPYTNPAYNDGNSGYDNDYSGYGSSDDYSSYGSSVDYPDYSPSVAEPVMAHPDYDY